MHRSPSPRYLRIILGISLRVLLLAAAINSLVDPLRVINAPWRLDFVDKSRDISEHTRTGKAGLITSNRDLEIALVGSSRVAIGMRHDDPAWEGRKTLNLGMPYSMLSENAPLLDYLLENSPGLEWVVFNLDLGDLSSNVDNRHLGDFDSSPLRGSFRLEDRLKVLLGPTSVRASIATFQRHAAGAEGSFSPGGDWSAWYTPRPRELLAEAIFEHHNPVDYRYGAGDEEMKLAKVRRLRESLAKCLERDIRVTLTIIPTHALTYTWLGEGDAPGPPWEQERRAIAALVSDLQQTYPASQLEWWDFSVFHPLTTERFAPAEDPQKNTEERPEYWADHAHPGPVLCSIMSARIAGTPVPEHPGPPFGRRLDGKNLEPFFAELVEGDAAYRAAETDEIGWVKEIIKSRQP